MIPFSGKSIGDVQQNPPNDHPALVEHIVNNSCETNLSKCLILTQPSTELMSEKTVLSSGSGRLSRLFQRVRSVSPLSLGMLGLLVIPGAIFPQLSFLEKFRWFLLFFLFPLVKPIFSGLRGVIGENEHISPRGWIDTSGGIGALVSLPLTFVNPLALRQDVIQFLGSAAAVIRNRGRLPSPETHEQSVTYRLPVEGSWTVVNGSPIKEYSHSWFPATQRYAYDFVITDHEGRTRPEDADGSLQSHYCYGEPVVAPADGVVVATGDGDPEAPVAGGFSHPLKRSFTGNYVRIRHAESEYSTLAHLVPGSVAVTPGERVERGDHLGQCGHSGNSTEPHLHFQLHDHADFGLSAGLPVAFENVTIESPGADVSKETDWQTVSNDGEYIHVGQQVTHDPGEATDRQGNLDVVSTGPVPGTGVSELVSYTLGGTIAGGLACFFAGGLLSVSAWTIGIALAAAGALGLAARLFRRLRNQNYAPPASVGLVAGTWLVAGAAIAVARIGAVPEIATVRLGGATVLIGFLLYIITWEVGRLRLDWQSDDSTPT